MAAPLSDCKHFGEPTGERVLCSTCEGRVQLQLFKCAVLGVCTPRKAVAGVPCCNGSVNGEPCEEYEPCDGQ